MGPVRPMKFTFICGGESLLPFNLLNLAGRKGQFVVDAEMNGLVLRIRKAAYRLATLLQPLKQRDRLKELKRARIFPQDVFHQRTV